MDIGSLLEPAPRDCRLNYMGFMSEFYKPANQCQDNEGLSSSTGTALETNVGYKILLQYVYGCFYKACKKLLHTPLYLNVLHSVFPPFVLSTALADQQTNAASPVWALSHTAVFFFYVRPCCLPLWCQTLFLSEHFTLHLQNCPDGWQRACVCSHAICSLWAWTTPPPLPSWLKWSWSLLLALWGLSHIRLTQIAEYIWIACCLWVGLVYFYLFMQNLYS